MKGRERERELRYDTAVRKHETLDNSPPVEISMNVDDVCSVDMEGLRDDVMTIP